MGDGGRVGRAVAVHHPGDIRLASIGIAQPGAHDSPVVDTASGRRTAVNTQHQRLPDVGGVSGVTLLVCRAALTATCSCRSLLKD
jgi:hypothetical protein